MIRLSYGEMCIAQNEYCTLSFVVVVVVSKKLKQWQIDISVDRYIGLYV